MNIMDQKKITTIELSRIMGKGNVLITTVKCKKLRCLGHIAQNKYEEHPNEGKNNNNCFYYIIKHFNVSYCRRWSYIILLLLARRKRLLEINK